MLISTAKRVVIAGQGYVGLPLALAAVDAGYQVTGIDLDRHKVGLLSAGKSIVEDIPDSRLKLALGRGTYRACAEYEEAAGFDIAIVTVPTPLKDGDPDLSFIESAAKEIGKLIAPGCLIVLESTTYPGTTEELLVPVLEKSSGLVAGKDFTVGYSPERIDPGNSTWNLKNTPKIVSGIDAKSLREVKGFYENLGIKTVPVSGTRVAEMTKLLENTFRHVNIALVNELAKFSRSLGVNIWEAIEAADTKPFGYMKFSPGPGVGGHCLPIDPTYLSWAIKDRSGSDFQFVSLANDVNKAMPEYVLERAREILLSERKQLRDSRILLLGIAYKADTGDTRESPALSLAGLLSSEGANVFAVDELVPEALWPANIGRVVPSDDSEFDLAVLITNHSAMEKDWTLARATKILDTRNCLHGPNVEKM